MSWHRAAALSRTRGGYEAFFYNPAGFSREDGVFTLSSMAWVYSRPDQLIAEALREASGTTTPAETFSVLSSQVTTGGFGAGSSIGVGFTEDGLGFGAALIVDSMLHGSTILGATGDLTATVGFFGGLSVPFELLGMKLSAGADLRPMIRIHVPMTNAAALALVYAIAAGTDIGQALSSADALHGAGLGVDLGLLGEAGWLSFGLSVRDLGGTRFVYSTSSLGEVQGALAAEGRLPVGSAVSDSYVIPMDISAGLSFHPDLGSFTWWVDPSIRLDIRDIGGLVDGSAIFWSLLHIGAEVRFLNLIALRGGLCQGYLTAGIGVRMAFLDLSIAIFTRELGAHLGDWPSSCTTVNASFVF